MEAKTKNSEINVNFVRYAWFTVGYTILVILWGAVVRATGSGAGCGNHWPICNGEIIPRPENMQVLIEFSHRLTSGLCGIFILILLVWAFRMKPMSKFVRAMAVMSFIFVIIEGGIGAALVRLELVEDNASALRAWAIGLHLVNTLVLLAFQALTAWGASVTAEQRRVQRFSAAGLGVIVAIVALAVLSAFGAVTALGDTLLMHGSLNSIMDVPEEHFIVQLRVYHPVLAIVVSAYLYAFGYWLMRQNYPERVQRRNQWMIMLVSLQLGVGIMNIFLKAPVWMQVSHLLIADTMWIVLLLLGAGVITNVPETVDAPLPSLETVRAAGD